MKHQTIFSCILSIALLASCSGWKSTSSSSSFLNVKTSSKNVNVDTPHVKASSDDNSSSIKIFGKEIKKKQKEVDTPFADDKHFLNGDKCRYCDYISRTENNQGNLEEVEVSGKYKNGEEREYHDGKIIRSSYYVDGGKAGMEYTYVDEKIVDSIYIQTTYNDKWNAERLHNALPSPAADYIYDLYFAKEKYQGFAITTHDSLISSIFYKSVSDTGSGLPLVATIEYQNHREPSNFKIYLRKPFFETLVYQNNELAERKKVKGNTTVYEFKKDQFVKELYTNGKTKRTIMGGIQAKADESWQCSGECHSKSFYENGSRWEESYFTNNKARQVMRWNKQNVLIFNLSFPHYSKSFYDDGALEQEMHGELAYDSANNVIVKNGYIKEFYPNGKPKTDDTYENGNYVKHTTWYPNGNIDIEAEVPKYLKQYYENGQLEQSDEGEITQENGELILVNGTSKSYFANGTLKFESIFKNKDVHSFKTWDSTGFLDFDFERDKYIKTYTNTTPSKHLDWSGNVVHKDNDFRCEGNCTKRIYLDKIIIYQAIDEKYDSAYGAFKKSTVTQYDSSGKKISEDVYNLSELVSQKKWDSEKGFLKSDYSRDSHLKTYYEPQKMSLQFKGKSSKSSDSLTYINGTETAYHKNGKKSSETVWKDKIATSRKEWNENGMLTTEFEFNKYFITYYPNTKAVKLRYEGTVFFNGNKKYIVNDGTLQSFDEKGNQTSTKKYVKGFPIGS